MLKNTEKNHEQSSFLTVCSILPFSSIVFHCTSLWTCRSVKMFQRFRPQIFEDRPRQRSKLVQLSAAGPAPLPWKSRSWSSQTRTKPSLPPVLGQNSTCSGDGKSGSNKLSQVYAYRNIYIYTHNSYDHNMCMMVDFYVRLCLFNSIYPVER